MSYPRRTRGSSPAGRSLPAGARAGLVTRVRSVADVTGQMRQIELTGPDLRALRPRPGAHLVVRVPAGAGHARRVYSIWHHDPRDATLTLRVAVHPAGGPGCVWARGAAVGDRITVELPRSKITLDATAGFHLFIGDDTGAVPLLAMRAALHRPQPPQAGQAQAGWSQGEQSQAGHSWGGPPQAGAGARRVGAEAPVVGVFESAGANDEVPGADGVPALPWVHRGSASPVASRVLLRAVQDLELPAGSGIAYVAGEADTCRLLQRHLVEQRGWPRRAVLLQPQWAPGRPGFGSGAD